MAGIKELHAKYVNEKDAGKHVREIGHYYASEVYYMKQRHLIPKNFFKKKPIDIWGCECIAGGVAYENYLTEMLQWNKANCKYQERREIKIDDFTVTVKPDYVFPDKVWETKRPDKPMDNMIPDKWKHQLELEYRAFEKPTYLGIFRNHPLLTLIPYESSEEVWSDVQDILRKFHKELLLLNKKKDEKINS